MWFFLSFPAELLLWNCGSGRDEEPSGGKVLRLIQIRLTTPKSEENYASLSSQFAATPNCRFEFEKRGQFFICSHNETLPIIAVCISNPDSSPLRMNGLKRNTSYNRVS